MMRQGGLSPPSLRRCRNAVALSLILLQPPPLLGSGAAIRARHQARGAMSGRHAERAWDWWRSIGSPRAVCAPMVGGSELAFRLLVRKHGVELAYTPMISAKAFLAMSSEEERRAFMEPAEGDRPLIVQFCTNEPEEFLQAALLVQGYCDAVDLNLGCPKDMGRRYGAILMEEPEVVRAIVERAASCPDLRVPVTCKIRVWRDRARSVAFARMLQASGCSLLTVHGRERACGGEGASDWGTVAAVKEALDIPVLANGGMVRTAADADAFREATGADGVMCAVGLLLDPQLFRGPLAQGAAAGHAALDAISHGFEYLSYAEAVPTGAKNIRAHLQYLLRPLACPTHKGRHHSGSDRHADVWGLLTNANNLRNALQARKLLEILAWRLGHPSVTREPTHTLKDVKNLRSAETNAASDSETGEASDLFAG